MKKILILSIAIALLLVGGAFVSAQAQTGGTCHYEGCALEFNSSPCSWAWCDVLPWNWNWSALSPCNWRSACKLTFISHPNPAAQPPAVAEAIPQTG